MTLTQRSTSDRGNRNADRLPSDDLEFFAEKWNHLIKQKTIVNDVHEYLSAHPFTFKHRDHSTRIDSSDIKNSLEENLEKEKQWTEKAINRYFYNKYKIRVSVDLHSSDDLDVIIAGVFEQLRDVSFEEKARQELPLSCRSFSKGKIVFRKKNKITVDRGVYLNPEHMPILDALAFEETGAYNNTQRLFPHFFGEPTERWFSTVEYPESSILESVRSYKNLKLVIAFRSEDLAKAFFETYLSVN